MSERTSFNPAQIREYYKANVPGLVEHGNQFRAKCPLHNGERDSLSINADTGLWTCHSECGSGNIFQFEAKIRGISVVDAITSVQDWLGVTPEKTQKKEHKWQMVCSYPYTDRDGKLLYEVVRLEDQLHPGEKSFRVRRPDSEAGKWIWNLGAIKPVLYRLPELVDSPVAILGEGEKDVDNLRALGFVATTCALGAKKWQSDLSEFLAGKHVTIFPDKDEKGQEHLDLITKSLLPKAASVRVVMVPKGKDVSDWIKAGATKEIIQQAIDNAQPLTYTVKSKTTSNEDIERTILSLCLKHPDHFGLATERLKSDDFTGKLPKIVFGAMQQAALTASPDAVNTWAAIQSSGWDKLCPKERLDELVAESSGQLSKLGDYCKTLKQFTLKRNVGVTARELTALAHSPETGSEAVARAEALVAKLADEKIPERPLMDLGATIETLGSFDKFLNPYHGEKLIETGFADLDDMIVGLMPGTVTLVAARPSVGKSTLAGQIAYNVACNGEPTAIFSLEMMRSAVFRRLVSGVAEVPTYAMKKGTMTREQRQQVYDASERIMGIPLFIADQFGKKIRDVKAAVRSHEPRPKVVVIDYFQLMKGTRKSYPNRREELSEVSSELKNELAIPLNIALVVVASFSRAYKQREDKAPQLSDLYETGQLEYDADLVLALDRPEQHKADGDKSKTLLYVLKQRDGATGKIELTFVPEFVKFKCLTPAYNA